MEKKMYFESPTQVAFWDTDGDHYVGGIAYLDEVICGCCGGITSIEEIYEFAPEFIKEPIVEYDTWVDLEEAICGDEKPVFKNQDKTD